MFFDSVSNFVDDCGIDFLFVDGDKSRFSEDFDRYWPLVNRGGIVAFHDIFDDGSPMQKSFIEKRRYGKNSMTIIDTSECDRVKEQKLSGFDSETPSYDQWVEKWMYSSCGFGLIEK